MHSRFDNFLRTSLGQQLDRLIDTPERYIEYAALSRADVPAIAAVVADLRAHFPEVEENETARQFCGAKVAEVMRNHHHEMLRVRGRVPGGYFTYGAVWSPFPVKREFAQVVAELAAMPDRLSPLIQQFSESLWRSHPEDGTSFSLVEHACHLRDLDEVYRDRLARILTEHIPSLPDVNGRKLAKERAYDQQSLEAAVRQFRKSRLQFVKKLKALTPKARARLGVYAETKRMTVEDLAEMVQQHDATHLQEIEELRTALSSQNGGRRSGKK
jgi:hypothetical protein